jgi:O-antigen/teichoic acid export membrane protein
MSEKKIAGLKSGMKWTALRSVSIIVGKLIRGAVIPKILPPASYGLLTSVGLFTRYLQFSDFGTGTYFVKEIPHLHFNKSDAEKQRFANEMYSLIVLSFALVIVYLGCASFFYSGDSQDFYQIALLLLIPTTIFLKTKELYVSYAFGTQNYRLSTTTVIGSDFLSLILTIAGIYFYGALGGVVGMLLVEILLFFYVKQRINISFKFVFSRDLFRHWKQIIKQFLVSISELVAGTIDQWFILRIFKLGGLGLYSLGLTFGWLMISISSIFTDAAYAKVVATAKVNKEGAMDLIVKSLFFYLLSCLLVLPGVFYAVETVITFYLDEYKGGLNVYFMMIFSGMVKGALILLRTGFIAMDKERKYIFYCIINVGISCVGYGLALLLDFSFYEVIPVIAMMDIISFCVLYFALITKKDVSFWKNIALFFSAFLMVFLYQFVFRNDAFEFLEINLGMLYLVLVFAAFAVVILKSRQQFIAYLK